MANTREYYNAKFKEELPKHSINQDFEKAKHEWVRAGGYNPDSIEYDDDGVEHTKEGNGQTSFSYYLAHFSMKFPQPEYETRCICTHHIKHNCYIYNPYNKKALVVGNCCIKQFLPNNRKTCEVCGDTHKRTTKNICQECEKYGKKPMKFGKYKGKPLLHVWKLNKDYLVWCSDNIKPLTSDMKRFMDKSVPRIQETYMMSKKYLE